MNIRPLLRLVCTRFLGDMCGFVDMCVAHVPNPKANAMAKVSHIYTGPTDSSLAQDMIDCNPDVSAEIPNISKNKWNLQLKLKLKFNCNRHKSFED